MAERHQRLAGHLEIAVRHADRGFLMHAGEKFRIFVAAVIDQRLMNAAEARGAVRWEIFEVQGLDDIDHEIGTSDALDATQVFRGRGLGSGDVHARRQCRRRARRGRIGGRSRRGSTRYRWRRRCRRASHRDARQELAPAHFGKRVFSGPMLMCHEVLR